MGSHHCDNNHHDNSASSPLQKYFFDWHPLRGDWMDGLTEDIKDIARSAQQCLMDNKRNEKELAEAISKIQEWKNQGLLPVNDNDIPGIIRKEKLGCQLKPGILLQFLLAYENTVDLRHYEFIAIALLQEIHGLSELELVAGKSQLSINVQYFMLKIVKLHTALLFLRMMDTAPPEQQELLKGIAAYLFKDKELQL